MHISSINTPADTQHLPLTHEIMSAALHIAGMSAGAGTLGEDLAAVKRCLFAAANMAYEMENRVEVASGKRPAWANPLDLTLAAPADARAKHTSPLLFLACPYSHPDEFVRTRRALDASDMAAQLMAVGYAVFSPISHGHAIYENEPVTGTVQTAAEAWTGVNDRVLLVSSALVVLGLPGCMESAGVRHEVSLAAQAGIPVNMIRLRRDTLVVERDVDPMLWSDAEGKL